MKNKIILFMMLAIVLLSISGCYKQPDMPITGPEEQFTLKTDKTEYGLGEPVAIMFYNGFNNSAVLDGGTGCEGEVYIISKYENGTWRDFKFDLVCGLCQAEVMEIIESHSGFLKQWDQKIYDPTPSPYGYCEDKELVGEGIYKIKVVADYYNSFVESNEFKIVDNQNLKNKVYHSILEGNIGYWAKNPDGTVKLEIIFTNGTKFDEATKIVKKYGGKYMTNLEGRQITKDTWHDSLVVIMNEDSRIFDLAKEDKVKWVNTIPAPSEIYNQ